MRLMTRHLLLALAAGIALAGHALAQSAGVLVRLRGKIDTVSRASPPISAGRSGRNAASRCSTLCTTG
jgi:hypothetical protein